MTRKALISTAGVLEAKIRITSVRGRRRITGVYRGRGSARNIRQNFREALNKAVRNAYWEHINIDGGNYESVMVSILDYRIRYFNDLIKIETKNIRGKRRVLVRNTKTGRFIKNEKFTYVRDIEGFRDME